MTASPMIKHELAALLEQAVREAQARGLLPAAQVPEAPVEHPQNPAHGDYASSLPMKLARAARKNPLEIARTVAELLPPHPAVARVEVAAPGFVNIRLADGWVAAQVESIRQAGERFGAVEAGAGTKVQVEFVSVNPTGPIHVGHGRGAVLGSTLARVLEAAGYTVQREYYVNDAGSQMELYYRCLYARCREALGHPLELPADGYRGQYVKEWAERLLSEQPELRLRLQAGAALDEMPELRASALRFTLDRIREDLALLGIGFDEWFSEQGLYDSGLYDRVMALLRERGHVQEKEGARWFVSTALGEDKDNVLVRSSGLPTYFASDIAYHYDKFVARGFDRVIDIWGADHQGHVSRMKAVMTALGLDPARLQIVISQLVTLRRGAAIVRVSKRTGDIITLRELVEEVGPDACRFFFLARSADAQMDFDLELAKRESQENPVYYVQYAHARIAGILEHARREKGITSWDDGAVSLLTHPAELALVRLMLQLPETVELIARTLEAQHLPRYAQELATAFHLFYRDCRVVDDAAPDLTRARLKLMEAARLTLARVLGLMGIAAPEQM
ncbi:MAG: arginine--tRNA ligase [Chloroflexi bacterium]|nr:arginine--tRNA ligase [Chloroflexota bacterium]